MEFFECVFGRRACRRFKQDAIPMEDLLKIVDAGRYAPTGYNYQGMRFAIVSSAEKVAEAFASTGWLTGRPPEGQQPTAYIAVLYGGETAVSCATYAVMLAAHALGYGSCWHGCSGSEKVKKLLGLDDAPEQGVLISLGRPDETFEVKDPAGPDELKVSKAEDGTVHLGKLSREQAIVATF